MNLQVLLLVGRKIVNMSIPGDTNNIFGDSTDIFADCDCCDYCKNIKCSHGTSKKDINAIAITVDTINDRQCWSTYFAGNSANPICGSERKDVHCLNDNGSSNNYEIMRTRFRKWVGFESLRGTYIFDPVKGEGGCYVEKYKNIGQVSIQVIDKLYALSHSGLVTTPEHCVRSCGSWICGESTTSYNVWLSPSEVPGVNDHYVYILKEGQKPYDFSYQNLFPLYPNVDCIWNGDDVSQGGRYKDSYSFVFDEHLSGYEEFESSNSIVDAKDTFCGGSDHICNELNHALVEWDTDSPGILILPESFIVQATKIEYIKI